MMKLENMRSLQEESLEDIVCLSGRSKIQQLAGTLRDGKRIENANAMLGTISSRCCMGRGIRDRTRNLLAVNFNQNSRRFLLPATKFVSLAALLAQ